MKRNIIVVAAAIALIVAVAAYAQSRSESPNRHAADSGRAAQGFVSGMAGGTMGGSGMMGSGAPVGMGSSGMMGVGTMMGGMNGSMMSADSALMAMEPEMMRHMVAHMQSGTMAGMMQSLQSCPLVPGGWTAQGAPSRGLHHENGGGR